MCYFHGDAQVPGGEIFYTEIAEVELQGKHIVVNASERKMNVKFSSEAEAERWQSELGVQVCVFERVFVCVQVRVYICTKA
jgi:hypothetical protein